MTKYEDYHTFFNKLYNLHKKGIFFADRRQWNEEVCAFIGKNNELVKNSPHFFALLKEVDAHILQIIADNPPFEVRKKMTLFYEKCYGKMFELVKKAYRAGTDDYEYWYNTCREMSLKRISYKEMKDKAAINHFFVSFAHIHLDMLDEMYRERESVCEMEMIS